MKLSFCLAPRSQCYRSSQLPNLHTLRYCDGIHLAIGLAGYIISLSLSLFVFRAHGGRKTNNKKWTSTRAITAGKNVAF